MSRLDDRATAAADLPSDGDERFRQLAAALPIIVWTAAPECGLTWANERWYEYTGLGPGNAPLGWIDRVVHPDDRARCLEQWARAVQDAAEFEIELRQRRHDGVYRWFLARVVPIRSADAAVSGWCGTTIDIHDRKELEASLEAADRRKDASLAALAHDLRNSLAPLRNAVEIVRLGTADPRMLGEVWNVMDRQVGHLVRLVDGLLDMSRATRPVEARREGSATADHTVTPDAVAAAAPGPDVVAAAAPDGKPSQHARRVLIVEDDPDSADSLRMLLELRGHDVRLARDGHAGIAAVRSERPDLI